MKILCGIEMVFICMLLCAGCGYNMEDTEEMRVEYDEFQQWLVEKQGEQVGEETVAVMIPYSSEMFFLQLAGEVQVGVSMERMSGQEMIIRGRKDTIRGYFEGSVEWNGQELCIVDFTTMKYVILDENLKSFTLGDYYISCEFAEDEEKLELLVFYCPVWM